MTKYALVLLGASLAALALAALGINRSRTPNGTYLAAILGVIGIGGLLIGGILTWLATQR